MNLHAIDGPSWVLALAAAFAGVYVAASAVRGTGRGRTLTVFIGAACIWFGVIVLVVSAVRNA